jgi:hypothetical protein
MRDRSNLPDWPASMRRDLAAAYLDISLGTFDKIVAEGRLPRGLALTQGSRIWLRRDLDALLAKLRGLPNDPVPRPIEDAIAEWDALCDGTRESAVS